MAVIKVVILFLALCFVSCHSAEYKRWKSSMKGQYKEVQLEIVEDKLIRFPDNTNHTIVSVRLPKGVKKHNLKPKNVHILEVTDDAEIEIVKDALKVSSPLDVFNNIAIYKIYRVENIYKYYQYHEERKNMKAHKYPKDERWLWFSSAPAWDIATEGFDVSKTSYANGVLGSGIHFYTKFEDAFKDKIELHSNGARRMILAQVAMGVICDYDPALKYAHAPKNCNSVTKKTTTGTTYAVYKSAQAYPQYIVEYYYDIFSTDN